jgi:hypothetical protein
VDHVLANTHFSSQFISKLQRLQEKPYIPKVALDFRLQKSAFHSVDIQKLARKKYFCKAFPQQATFTHNSQFMPLSSGLMPQNGKTCNYLAIAIASSYFENRSKAGSLKKTSKPQRLWPYLGTMNKIKQNAMPCENYVTINQGFFNFLFRGSAIINV